MLPQAFWISLRILIFRAGPEDLPFDPSPRLTRVALLFAMLSFAAFFALTLPPPAAGAASAVAAAALWLVTRVTLRLRKLENRFQQTFNSLLITSALLTLAMIPPFSQLAPVIVELYAQLRKNPDVANHPENWPQPSAAASLLFDVLCLWQLVVCSRIYGRAAATGSLGGLGISLLSIIAMSMLMLFAAPLISLFVS
jgi:hypothetical protein